ncbi:hypothetical protein HC761_00210 [bacterium]|nr:hypothetical protein [bacterium]
MTGRIATGLIAIGMWALSATARRRRDAAHPFSMPAEPRFLSMSTDERFIDANGQRYYDR